MRGLRLASLFLGYGVLGVAGGWVVGLLGADEPGRVLPVKVEVTAAAEDAIDVDVRALGQATRCAFEAERDVSLPASASERLRVEAGSGELVVRGREGLDRVQAVGRACASEEDALASLTLTVQRSGGDVVLSAHYPDRPGRGGWGGGYARIDLIIEVPARMAVDIDDSSGSMEVSGTGETRIDDSSGSISVSDVDGALSIDDSSGEIEVRGVSGDVDIEDGSGEVDVRAVAGSVHVRDGSGSITVLEVGRDVLVDSDGSGSITVRDVRGDFRVGRDGSGGIRYSGIDGQVDIPRGKRERSGG